MSKDITEYYDDYCRDLYGHTNWAYISTFSKAQIAQLPEGQREGGIYFFKEEVDDET